MLSLYETCLETPVFQAVYNKFAERESVIEDISGQLLHIFKSQKNKKEVVSHNVILKSCKDIA